ncbi:MAG: flagellin [Ignavibacteria bacterium]|nr:flagellin [Ignavibacteria bacterium]
MPTAIAQSSRIRTNTPAENAYNALQAASNNIALRQLRLSTGKRINTAADDVAGYITSRALQARNGALKKALLAAGEAMNVTAIAQDALDNITGLLTQIKDAAAQASTGALGTAEKVALAKASYRLAQQIQFVVDSTVFGGKQLLWGNYSGTWAIGFYADNTILSIGVDLTTNNSDFNIASNNFNLNATSSATSPAGLATSFAGVSGLSLESLNSVSESNLGIFSTSQIATTLTSLAMAIDNVNKVASYLGGIQNRINSHEELLKSQITNYNAAISRIEDADVAQEQLELIKQQFLLQASLISLTQANQQPQAFLQLFR